MKTRKPPIYGERRHYLENLPAEAHWTRARQTFAQLLAHLKEAFKQIGEDLQAEFKDLSLRFSASWSELQPALERSMLILFAGVKRAGKKWMHPKFEHLDGRYRYVGAHVEKEIERNSLTRI